MVEGRSLATTPTWAVATVIAAMIGTVFVFNNFVEYFGKWLDKRKRKPLVAALEKIKEELMVFGLMSLLLGHWSIFVAKICIKTSKFGRRGYPCIPETKMVQHFILSNFSKEALPKEHKSNYHDLHTYCEEGYESFASYESLEQLHRLLFVLGVTHITYSSIAIALAVIKIYSWRVWENEAKSMATHASSDYSSSNPKLKRLSTFVLTHASHPWSQHRLLIWLLCFSRQFWSSINESDYTALRFCFITAHQLPLSYDFLNYMARSMHDEFRDIVGISFPLWIYAIFCIYLDFHGSRAYFWLSFLPAAIIISIGTKLHHIVVKLALETVDSSPYMQTHVFRLRDELFWLRKPKLLLRLIQFTSFQNAFEMAMFIWSLWEISGTSCFMKNPSYMVIRLTFGVMSQVWCSYITFPLYVIITQMGSKFKRTVVAEGVRKSLHGWQKRVNAKRKGSANSRLSSSSSMPLIQNYEDDNEISSIGRSSRNQRSRRLSLEDGYGGVVSSSRRSGYEDEEFSDEDDDSYSSSGGYEGEDDNVANDVRYFHIP
ncbi:hypothetical protein RND81_13G214100 [Saponaria officinalis]|uniref:MLO-like protein n=1 Tax=Saponaria officinalis TaxID=3572 RepID=A0AAW1H2M6_SAPOF